MAKSNRLRCPSCGICYEGDIVASETTIISCQNCGASVKLQEEDPDGVFSGALPSELLLLPFGAALILSLLSFWHVFFAVIGFLVLLYLAGVVIFVHRQHREARISLWNSLSHTYSTMKGQVVQLSVKIEEANQRYAKLSELFATIDPDRRDQLAAEITSQLRTLGVLDSISTLADEKETLIAKIADLKSRIVCFEDEELYQNVGLYKPLYDCTDSTTYRKLIEDIRDRQKMMVKGSKATREDVGVATTGSNSGGKKSIRNLEKMILRAFNGECEAIIDRVTSGNLGSISARVTKSFHDINDLCEPFGVSLLNDYLNLKIEELHLCYEYQLKCRDEREEQRKIREEMREQAKLIKEIEEAREKIEKEKTHFDQAIAEIKTRIEAASASEKLQYEAKLREYEEKLFVVMKDKEEVEFREQSTRAGYVYIISNIGSFGESVYKIGVTRRLEPQERIDELGDASVPFGFDVHALIFSEDAPSLEGALHEHFADRAVNRVNPRKEFFRVGLDEIEEVVRTHHNKVVEFTKQAKAEAYRISQAKVRSMA